MLPRADIVGTRPVASVEATRPIIQVGDAHQELSQRLNRIALGSFLEGEVLSRLQDGTFVVKVADTAVRMNLPAGTQVGKSLDLTLVATQPRPTFLLASQARDNPPTLSNAGKLIDWIIHTAKAAGAPVTLTGKTPLVPSANADTGQIASSMKDSLEFSGLFYESHLEHWASGERPLSALLREPQAGNSNPRLLQAALQTALKVASQGQSPADTDHVARLIASLSSQPEAARNLLAALHAAYNPDTAPAALNASPQDSQQAPQALARTDGEAIAALPVDISLSDTLAEASKNATLATAAPLANEAEAAGLTKSMSSESINMVNLQLNTLEQHRIAWQGELWPGQPIEWEIDEDTPQTNHAEFQERTWQSVIRFELPTLGKVAATIRLTGERVQVQVRAANEDTATLLRAHGDTLGAALAAAGSPLEQFSVKRDAKA